jgi:hypothetical protein
MFSGDGCFPLYGLQNGDRSIGNLYIHFAILLGNRAESGFRGQETGEITDFGIDIQFPAHPIIEKPGECL